MPQAKETFDIQQVIPDQPEGIWMNINRVWNVVAGSSIPPVPISGFNTGLEADGDVHRFAVDDHHLVEEIVNMGGQGGIGFIGHQLDARNRRRTHQPLPGISLGGAGIVTIEQKACGCHCMKGLVEDPSFVGDAGIEIIAQAGGAGSW